MKKRIANQIRDFAKTLPPSAEVQLRRRPYSGAEMIEKGVELKDGKEIDPKAPKGFYSRLEPYAKPINHARKLKRYYKKYGNDFIKHYTEWFVPYHANMKKKYPGLFEKKESVIDDLSVNKPRKKEIGQ